MQITWAADDIKSGIIAAKANCHERWMIGYASVNHERKFTLNSLCDGMVNIYDTREELAARLTRGNMLPAVILDHPRFEYRKHEQPVIAISP